MRSFVRTEDAPRVARDLALVTAGAVTALATPAPSKPERSVDALRDHERIARDVHTRSASLPARFGMHYATQEDLATAIAEKQDTLVRDLDAVGDRVELAIVLSWRETPPPGAEVRTGRDYLARSAARQRAEREAEAVVRRLIAHVGSEQALTRESICPRDGVAATVAVLAKRGEEHVVRERAARFEDESGVTVEVYGPMPPYSFVS